MIDIADTTVTFVHETPPTVTVAPARKFVPVMVIDVPPALVPEEAETLDTVGAVASALMLPPGEVPLPEFVEPLVSSAT